MEHEQEFPSRASLAGLFALGLGCSAGWVVGVVYVLDFIF